MAPTQRDLIDINKENLYDILGVPHNATDKEISRSYKKRALKLHPDKNPDPAAHKLFLKLTQVLELLTDPESRENYDTVLKAREAARLRTQQLDSKRRKLKEKLERREGGDNSAQAVRKAELSLQETIKKLQAEGESLLKREEEKLRQEFSAKTDFVIADKATLKLKWKCKKDDPNNGGYSKIFLKQLLQKYGPVSDIIVNSKRKGSALAVFDSIAAAKICMQKEKGLQDCPLLFRMIHETDSADLQQKPFTDPTPNQSSASKPSVTEKFSSFPSEPAMFGSFPSFGPSVGSIQTNEVDRDYESLTLMRLRQAEERKRLIEEIQKEDANNQNNYNND